MRHSFEAKFWKGKRYLLGLLKKPRLNWKSSLISSTWDLTVEIMMIFFSWPWNCSVEPTSISCQLTGLQTNSKFIRRIAHNAYKQWVAANDLLFLTTLLMTNSHLITQVTKFNINVYPLSIYFVRYGIFKIYCYGYLKILQVLNSSEWH